MHLAVSICKLGLQANHTKVPHLKKLILIIHVNEKSASKCVSSEPFLQQQTDDDIFEHKTCTGIT